MKRIVAGLLSIAMFAGMMFMTTAPAEARGGCWPVVSRGQVVDNIVPSVKVTWYIDLYGTRCRAGGGRNKTTINYGVVGYTAPPWGAEGCGRVQEITMNPSAIAGFNAPAMNIKCSDNGASRTFNIPDRVLSGDRSAYSTVKVRVERHRDYSHRTSSAAL